MPASLAEPYEPTSVLAVPTPRMFSLSASPSLDGFEELLQPPLSIRENGCIHFNQASFQPQCPSRLRNGKRFCGSLGAMMLSALCADDSGVCSFDVFLFHKTSSQDFKAREFGVCFSATSSNYDTSLYKTKLLLLWVPQIRTAGGHFYRLPELGFTLLKEQRRIYLAPERHSCG